MLLWRSSLARSASQADLRLFQAAVNLPSMRASRALQRLSVVANNSLLWQASALAMATAGGERGRRAATRGLVSVVATSAIVNLPLKQLVRRSRPPTRGLDPRRLLRHRPTSLSFPSGHSASAAAFATAVAAEWPVASVGIATVAAVVGFSRVTAGAHYPGDVIGGAAAGTAIALGVRRLWPKTEAPVPASWSSERLGVATSARGKGLVMVVNPGSAKGDAATPVETVRRELPEARILESQPDQDPAALLSEHAQAAEVLAVIGGDGTVTSVVDVALEHDKPLLLIPGGTLNHLARDLGLDSPSRALAAYRSGSAVRLDVGRIAGRPFVNTASLGAYVALVDVRERFRARLGKWPSLAIALVWALLNAQPVDVDIEGRREPVWLIFAGNCAYQPPGFAPLRRDRLDDGHIDVRVVSAAGRWSRTRLVAAAVTNLLGRTSLFRSRRVRRLDLQVHASPTRLSRDGETFEAQPAVTIEKDARQLVVFAA